MKEAQSISRDEAKGKGLLRYFTGEPCKNGHVSERLVSNWGCMACANERMKQRYATDSDLVAKVKQRDAARSQYFADYNKRNLTKRKGQLAKWRDENRESFYATIKQWKARNKDRACANQADRQAKKLRATVAWSDREAIERTYALAAYMTQVTGESHHVDHIVPLRGKTVCGLHVPANLRVIPATENLSKNNRVWPDMPEEFV
jgi:hypothetical protein